MAMRLEALYRRPWLAAAAVGSAIAVIGAIRIIDGKRITTIHLEEEGVEVSAEMHGRRVYLIPHDDEEKVVSKMLMVQIIEEGNRSRHLPKLKKHVERVNLGPDQYYDREIWSSPYYTIPIPEPRPGDTTSRHAKSWAWSRVLYWLSMFKDWMYDVVGEDCICPSTPHTACDIHVFNRALASWTFSDRVLLAHMLYDKVLERQPQASPVWSSATNWWNPAPGVMLHAPTAVENIAEIIPEGTPVPPGILHALQLLGEYVEKPEWKKYYWSYDLHKGNFGMTRGGYLIFVDPLYGGE